MKTNINHISVTEQLSCHMRLTFLQHLKLFLLSSIVSMWPPTGTYFIPIRTFWHAPIWQTPYTIWWKKDLKSVIYISEVKELKRFLMSCQYQMSCNCIIRLVKRLSKDFCFEIYVNRWWSVTWQMVRGYKVKAAVRPDQSKSVFPIVCLNSSHIFWQLTRW